MSKLFIIQQTIPDQDSFSTPLTLTWVIITCFAFAAYFCHNITTLSSKYSETSTRFFKSIQNLNSISIISNKNSSSVVINSPSGLKFNNGVNSEIKNPGEDQDFQLINLPINEGLINSDWKKFPTKISVQNEVVSKKNPVYENKQKKRIMQSYIILKKKLREIHRNIKENAGELNLSDAKPKSPVKKVNA